VQDNGRDDLTRPIGDDSPSLASYRAGTFAGRNCEAGGVVVVPG
jgi:hypothetical protein